MITTRRETLRSIAALLFLPSGLAMGTRVSSGSFLDAVRSGDLGSVRALLSMDPTLAQAKDGVGRSAFVLAHLRGHVAIAETVRATGLELDLVESAFAEDWERMEALAKEHPAQLHALHPVGGTPLYAHAQVGSVSLWRLRNLGCLPDEVPAGGTGFTPARGAVDSFFESWARITLTDLLSNGSDPNARQQGGDSVLHGAVRRRSGLLVTLAIRKGAQVDAQDDAGRTPLDLAVELGWEAGQRLLEGHAELVRDNRSSRLARDANRELIEPEDLSDVDWRAQAEVTGNSHFNLSKVKELLAGDRRLVWSRSPEDELAIEACGHTGNRPIIQLHLDHGAPLSLPTAVSLGDMETVRWWLARERGAHDFPVMCYAVFGEGGAAMAELLHGLGCHVDQESMGTTALHWCVLRGDKETAAWLLEHGANIQQVGFKWSRDGQTPLAFAEARGRDEMAAFLRQRGAR